MSSKSFGDQIVRIKFKCLLRTFMATVLPLPDGPIRISTAPLLVSLYLSRNSESSFIFLGFIASSSYGIGTFVVGSIET